MAQSQGTARKRRPGRRDAGRRAYLIPRLRVSVVREGWIRTRQPPHVKDDVALAVALAACFPEDDPRERFVIALLDARHHLVGLHTVSIGCLTETLVHLRDVLRVAILAGASFIGVAHNHCSGDPEPSREDVGLTRQLQRCAEMVGIRLLDHVVFGAGMCWVSLRQRGYVVPAGRARGTPGEVHDGARASSRRFLLTACATNGILSPL